MLSRTADHLYWMARYTERAENLARMIEVNYRMSLLPQEPQRLLEFLGLARQFGLGKPSHFDLLLQLGVRQPELLGVLISRSRRKDEVI